MPLLFLLVSPLCAQPKIPDTLGPKPAELGPTFLLPGVNATTFDSTLLLGNRALALILEGDVPTQNLNEAVAKAAKKAEENGVTTVFIATNPDTGKIHRAPAPLFTLRDDSKSLAKNYRVPSFWLVDRAGFIREITLLPPILEDANSKTLQTLLESARDLTPVLEVGKPAPDFGFKDARGVWRRVSDLRGRKNLALTFFPKCFTGRCKSHLSSLRDHFADFQKADTEIWAVSVDEAHGDAGQIAFSDSLGLPFPLLPDVGRNISLLYKAVENPLQLARRQTILIDKHGVVREIDTQVIADSHGEDVLNKLAAF